MLDVNEWAELVSLSLTVPTVLLAALVLYYYSPRAAIAIHKVARGEPVNEVDYLVIGIVIGFTGGILDNIWWGIAWGTKFFDLAIHAWWFDNGVFSNIPFRQSAGIFAALYHLWPVIRNGSHALVQKLVVGTCTLGSFIMLTLKKSVW